MKDETHTDKFKIACMANEIMLKRKMRVQLILQSTNKASRKNLAKDPRKKSSHVIRAHKSFKTFFDKKNYLNFVTLIINNM